MRNVDEEIKELEKDIKNLEVTKKEKSTQLESIKKEQREKQEAQQESIPVDRTKRDFYGKPILVGDWVNVTREGKFNETEGIVVKINKWITFEDRKGVKQCRAPCNLIVSDLPATYHVGKWNTGRSPKRQRP